MSKIPKNPEISEIFRTSKYFSKKCANLHTFRKFLVPNLGTYYGNTDITQIPRNFGSPKIPRFLKFLEKSTKSRKSTKSQNSRISRKIPRILEIPQKCAKTGFS